MGSTPRQHRYQIPMATRSTDVAELAKCPGAFLLKHVHEDDQAEATYFELGSALHESIEHTIKEDLDLDQALALVTGRIEDWIEGLDSQPIETSSRGVSTILEDAGRMVRSWFKWVHPDSDKRHPAYDDYEWPPQVEVPFTVPAGKLVKYPIWGSIDTVFKPKSMDFADQRALVDWKSGTSKQRDSNQLHFYELGFRHGVMPAISGITSWFHHLDRKQKRSVIQEADPYPGDRVVIRRIQQAEREKEQIINGGPVQFNPDWFCNFCVVRAHCPAEGEDSAGNRATLRRTLKLVRPMETIERVA